MAGNYATAVMSAVVIFTVMISTGPKYKSMIFHAFI